MDTPPREKILTSAEKKASDLLLYTYLKHYRGTSENGVGKSPKILYACKHSIIRLNFV